METTNKELAIAMTLIGLLFVAMPVVFSLYDQWLFGIIF